MSKEAKDQFLFNTIHTSPSSFSQNLSIYTINHTWRVFLTTNTKFSLHPFLLVNAVLATFSLPFPHNSVTQILPMILILLLSLVLLSWFIMTDTTLLSLNITSVCIGLLWALYVMFNRNTTSNVDTSLLVTNVFLISLILFNTNIDAFVHFILPIIFVLFWMDSDSQLRVFYYTTPMVVGFSIQYFIQKQKDRFIQRIITKLLKEKETLKNLSMIDPLTDVYNRRGFQNRLELIQNSCPGNHYVLMLDIDYFKSFNDRYGHAMGDQVLLSVSVAIQNAVRSHDIVTRFGGDEFIVILTNINYDRAFRVAERIRQDVYCLDIPHMLSKDIVSGVTLSIGLTPLHGEDIEHVLSLADKALYEAKNRGRNCIISK